MEILSDIEHRNTILSYEQFMLVSAWILLIGAIAILVPSLLYHYANKEQ